MNENKITGLAIWNMILSILVFMLMVALWSTQEDLKTLAKENAALVELLDQMVETDEALMRASENHSTAIMANSDSINEAVKGILYIIEVHREDHVESIAEIYQGHIIPLRAFHMENFNDPDQD